MSRLNASLVVSLKDDTGKGARSVKRNMTALEMAQKRMETKRQLGLFTQNDMVLQRALADQARFSFERDRDANMRSAEMHRQMVVRRRQQMEMQSDLAAGAVTTMRVASVATAAAAVVAAKAARDYAQLERQINRIVLNADKGKEAIKPTIEYLQEIGKVSQLGLEGAVTGLETLIASGRDLDDALAFLPAVAVTAQASGAAIEDVALSADSLSGSMKIGAKDMQRAFDILVAGGKAGKFELKDMAQYLPSLLPAFSALGYEGTEGLQKIVAMLQIVRNQAGSSSEAATYLGNVFQKMHSEETAKKFSKFGIDISKALAKAKAEGKDVLDVFLDMTELAVKGDMSKLTRLFTDAEMQKGVRALIMQRRELEAMNQSLKTVDGSAMRDFQQIVTDTQGSVERLGNSWDKLWTKLGEKTADAAVPVLDGVTKILDDADARAKGMAKTTGGDRDIALNQEKEYKRRYSKIEPGLNDFELSLAYNRALELVGRGAADGVMDVVGALEAAREKAAQYNHGYEPGHGPQGLDASPSTGKLPIPVTRPGQETSREKRERALREAYSLGTGREFVPGALKSLTDAIYAAGEQVSVRPEQAGVAFGKNGEDDGEISLRPEQRNRAADWQENETKPFNWLRFLLGDAMDEDFSFREHNGVDLRGRDSDQSRVDPRMSTGEGSGAAAAGVQRVEVINPAAIKGDGNGIMEGLDRSGPVAVPSGVQRVEVINPEALNGDGQGILQGLDKSAPVDLTPREVSILGTPTVITQPSGVQSVKIMNPTPVLAPINVSVTVHATTNANPSQIGNQVAAQIGDKVKASLAGLQADTTWDGG